MNNVAIVALALPALASMPAQASDALAHVETVQPPAWIERAGARHALAQGVEIAAQDHLTTGAQARAHLALADGSVVKLGEQAGFELPVLERKPLPAAAAPAAGQGGLLHGALHVLKGAFRFTTLVAGKLQRREIDVQIGPTITAGIRGTDIWGKSDGEQELLCLLEGKLQVQSPGQPAQAMEEPKTFYVVPHGAAPKPVVAVPEEKLATWVSQTELAAVQPALHAGGKFSLVIAQYTDSALATVRASQLDEAGYPVRGREVETPSAPLYALVMDGFATQAEAETYGKSLRTRFVFVKHPQAMAKPPQ